MPDINHMPPDTGEDYFRWFEGFDPFATLASSEVHLLDEVDASSSSNIAFPANSNVNAYATRRTDAQPPPVARVNAANAAPPQNNITATPVLPATFNPDAYSTRRTHVEPAVRSYAHREQHMRGLRLADAIAPGTQLWKQATDSLLGRIKFVDTVPGGTTKDGIDIILEPRLADWCGKMTRYHANNCANRIHKAVNPDDTQNKLGAEEILARMGLMPHAGGFPHEVCKQIQANINHLLKHMLWALDLDGMRKNKYKFYVPADHYRFARMLGLNPQDRDMYCQFDIVSTQGPNKGEKVGVWKGLLSQLTEEKGDQRKIPTKLQCKILLHGIFDDANFKHRVRELKLDRFSVRTCFANEDEAVGVRYQQALALSRSTA